MAAQRASGDESEGHTVDGQNQGTAEAPTDRPSEGGSAARTLDFTVVGIVASAGGLEALSALVQKLPTNAGIAYAIAQHLSASHKSLMTTLLSRETQLAVREISDDITPEPDTIYVTPPGFDVVLHKGKLRLQSPSGPAAAPKPSGDRLMTSLAMELGDRAVGVVLSGTGSDGSYGIRAIREAGGITIAQDLVTAKYDGMPSSAANTGCVDLVLPPGRIGRDIVRILSEPGMIEDDSMAASADGSDLLHTLLARTRVDFREYKETTINRRIQRRMTAIGITDYSDYVAHCRTNPNELDALFKDLLISVTRFFRDTAEFEALSQYIRQLVSLSEHRSIRLWVAGCATGEEAYSLAILVAEALGGPEAIGEDRVQIFATDIDKSALEVARRGVYPLSALHDVPEDLAQRYFHVEKDRVRVIARLRSCIMFSDHNVCQDPPFINIDLISMRNVLIYFGNRLQEKVLARLGYALNPGGLLFLGTSENISRAQIDLEPMSEKERIYRKRMAFRSGGSSRLPFSPSEIRSGHPEPKVPVQSADRRMFDSLARAISADSILVTSDGRILRVYGDLTPFLHISEQSRLNLQISILRSPFREEAASLSALALKRQIRRTGLRHADPGRVDWTHIQLEAIPLTGQDDGERYVLIAFHRHQVSQELEAADDGDGALPSARIRQLEADVASAREALEQMVEELQTSNEELQSVNEELQSTNEELQASNEELETSNEELQATNEELITVNEEMQVNATELSLMSSELSSVLGEAPLVVLVLDTALQIVRTSAIARRMFRLPENCENFHLSQCTVPDHFPSLVKFCDRTLRLRETVEDQIRHGESVFRMSCAPYFDDRNNLRGATLMISEVNATEMVERTELLHKMALVEHMAAIGHFRYDIELDTMEWSGRVYTLFGLEAEKTPPKLLDMHQLFVPEDRTQVEQALRTALRHNEEFQVTGRVRCPDDKVIRLELVGALIENNRSGFIGLVREADDSDCIEGEASAAGAKDQTDADGAGADRD
ncbi:hypothetical protein CBW24_12460 [Pacificitalea manganoxidans]|uniref:protein-glutamate O-methyltransferase n=1 Tax=Pacificitalea manganoxidans TaxID=1411902 RepID=A0A291M1F6_9RHOB|nr:hypothetical protein CBW24_12460 [Pacificitalea manganoxidans]